MILITQGGQIPVVLKDSIPETFLYQVIRKTWQNKDTYLLYQDKLLQLTDIFSRIFAVNFANANRRKDLIYKR